MPSLTTLTLTLLSLLPTLQAAVTPRQSRLRNARALYFITNNEQNAVVAAELGPDGLLTGRASSSFTGGLGGSGIDSTTGLPAAPASLFSQSALTILSPDLLLLVNPASNTLTAFTIPAASPLALKAIQPPLPLPGSFPVTVAASAQHALVCVGTAGARAGVTCARVDRATRMLGPFDALREFARPLNQTDPPRGPGGTVSQVFFDDGGERVLVTVKGDGTHTGFVAAYAVSASGEVAREPSWVVSPEGTQALSGGAAIPNSGGEVLVTDATFGAVVLGRDGGVKGGVRAEVEGQRGTAWAAVSAVTGTGWVADVGRNRLVEVDLSKGDGARVMGVVDLSGGSRDAGLVDLATAGEFVYALSPGDDRTGGPGVSVVNVRTRELVQHVEVGSVGADGSSMGMALVF